MAVPASAQFWAYERLVARVRSQLVAYAHRAWANAGLDDAAMDRMVNQMVPAVMAGQLRVADLTSLYLGRVTGTPVPVLPSVTQSRGVPPELVYQRPVISARAAIAQGKSIAQALDEGGRRLESLATTDLQLAKRQQAMECLQAAERPWYRRVPKGAESCALCLIASTKPYHTKDLMPIHPGCDCGIDVIPPGTDLDEVLDPKLLADTHEQVKLLTGISDSGGRAVDYRKVIITREHGELGPTLGWRQQKSSGPTDLDRKTAIQPPGKRLRARMLYSNPADDKPFRQQIAQARINRARTKRPEGPDTAAARVRAHMPADRIARNGRAFMDEIPPETRIEGERWYPDEHRALRVRHRKQGSPYASDPLGEEKIDATGASYAALEDWGTNKMDTELFFGSLDQPVAVRREVMYNRPKLQERLGLKPDRSYGQNIERAERVRCAETPDEVMLALRGQGAKKSTHFDNSPKLQDFYSALHGDTDVFVNDTWMGRIERLHPDERRAELNAWREAHLRQWRKSHPTHPGPYLPGERVTADDINLADSLADQANRRARVAAGLNPDLASDVDPYMPSSSSMLDHGYDLLAEGERMAFEDSGMSSPTAWQAASWIHARGSAW